MSQKIIVSFPRSLPDDTVAARKKSLATTLGVCCEDIVCLMDGVAVAVVDIPDAMQKAREKADKEAEKEAEKAKKEAEAAEAEAAKAAADATKTENHARGHAHAHAKT